MIYALKHDAQSERKKNVLKNNDLYGIIFPSVSAKLPPFHSTVHAYTLILDLDETLVYTELDSILPEKPIVHERPLLREFLFFLKFLPVEVVIFTAALQNYADPLLNVMDASTSTIHYRLYRQHTSILSGRRFKDLSLLNRNLSKTLIVDNHADMFWAQPNNGVVISSWEIQKSFLHPFIKGGTWSRKNDVALINLFFWIEYLCLKKMNVPDFLQLYRKPIQKSLKDTTVFENIYSYQLPFPIGKYSAVFLQQCFDVQIEDSKKCQCYFPTIPYWLANLFTKRS
ncbi:CTD nuclear envelope phosphatase 1-like [Hylaeus volcanicus]|uniref:CTD nuclear envelope phosphatase 1-like n=1 Tax=Hylaeus volcanicus TaxID=313075 RepID=UPI0023B87C32|nr:CTD nuclear envelope phosphatase 1-like [Hylaeus volcanicus]